MWSSLSAICMNYESDRPIRNVGFVKVETADDCTTIHIHGKGLRLGEETALKLYLFYPERAGIGVCVSGRSYECESRRLITVGVYVEIPA